MEPGIPPATDTLPEYTGGVGAGPARRRSSGVERVPWSVLAPKMGWRQGEHVTLVGPTGCGKTTLALSMLPVRKYVAVVATKPRDPLLSDLKGQGFQVVREWPPPDPSQDARYRRVVFWPDIGKMSDADEQRAAIAGMLSSVYRTGGWAVYLDEVRYITQTLGLQRRVELLWLQGRSLKLSVIGATQRPSWIPLEAYDQATHLFLWRETDARNLSRLGDIGGVDTGLIRRVVPTLPRHDALYVNTRTGALAITNARS